MIRLLKAAISGSWVTRMTVMPRLLVQPHEELHDLVARPGIEVACRLIGQDDRRVVHERPGNGDPLLLAAGKLVRMMVFPAFEPDALQRLPRPFLPFLGRQPVVQHGQFDIFEGRGAGQQVETLEHKAELSVPDLGQVVPGKAARYRRRPADSGRRWACRGSRERS